MRERTLRSGVNWQGSLKKKGVKQELGIILKCRSISVVNRCNIYGDILDNCRLACDVMCQIFVLNLPNYTAARVRTP